MSIELIAMDSFNYGGDRLKAGENFTASDRDAKLLMLVGKAKEKQKRVYKRRDMVPETMMVSDVENLVE
jgi:hypothetical protein